jgi:4-diphosphocytidyl-2-C-methyl-D-erythritol kinase
VPFFLLCEPCLARGIGEILEPLGKWPELWYVIISPQLPVSTAWVYQNYKMKLTREEYPFIKKQLKRDSLPVSQILENDLESVTSEKFPIIRTIKELLIENGAEGALMSGSGSSVFGVFGSLEKAQIARDRLALKNLGDVFLATAYSRKRVSSRQ